MGALTLRVSGLSEIATRLAGMAESIVPTIALSIETACDESVTMLAAAAPKGASSGLSGLAGLAGDAPGHLAESFSTLLDTEDTIVTGAVITEQPHKLELVRRGTGIYGPFGKRIVPRTKQALAWPGGEHPYRSVRGMRPNEFVTPIVESFPDRLRTQIRTDLSTLLRTS